MESIYSSSCILRLSMDQPSKKDIKLVRSLLQKKFRKELGLFVVEGKKMTEESIQSDFEVYAVFSTDPSFKSVYKDTILVSSKEMEQMSSMTTPSGYLAVLKSPTIQFKSPQSKMVLFLDGIGDPGNLGTILRTADWFGIQEIYCSNDTVELFNPKTIQSTMGSIFRSSLVYCNAEDILNSKEYTVYGAVLNGSSISDGQPLEDKRILVIGSESHGIREEVMPYIDHKITIPGGGGAESLNAAVAAGILMFSFTKD